MTKVQIPPVLRKSTGGEKLVQAAGADLGMLLRDLYERYPQLKTQLQVEEGLSSFVNVYLNGEDVRTLQGTETPVADADTVIILPAMAGGRCWGCAFRTWRPRSDTPHWWSCLGSVPARRYDCSPSWRGITRQAASRTGSHDRWWRPESAAALCGRA